MAKVKGLTLLFAGFLLLFSLFTISYAIPFNYKSIWFPSAQDQQFLNAYFLLGLLCTVCFVLSLHYLLNKNITERIEKIFLAHSDRAWIITITLLATLFPILIRLLILHHAALTDDEFAYQFSAELLTQGKLYLHTFPMKAFFDHKFIYNHDKMYSQYFLGWPLLMTPGIFLHMPGFMNALYAGITVPPLFWSIRQLTNAFCAKITALCYVLSPMAMIAASTQLSETSCLMILVWMTWWFISLQNHSNTLWRHFAFGLFFWIAFFIRPLSAIAIAIPQLCVWFYKTLITREKRWLKLLAFAIPTIILLSAFFAVNKAQTGAALTPAYATTARYREHHFVPASERVNNTSTYNISFSPLSMFITTFSALVRLNFATLGWPFSFLLLFITPWRKFTWLGWSTFISFLVCNLPTYNAGVPGFGPSHYFEILWPLMMLNAFCFYHAKNDSHKNTVFHFLFLVLIVFTVLNLSIYTPKRFSTLTRMARDINAIPNLVHANNIHNAIIFVPKAALLYCYSGGTKHYHFMKVDYDAALKNDVLYLNHINLADDQTFMTDYFPNRSGFLLTDVSDCQPILTPIHAAPGSTHIKH